MRGWMSSLSRCSASRWRIGKWLPRRGAISSHGRFRAEVAVLSRTCLDRHAEVGVNKRYSIVFAGMAVLVGLPLLLPLIQPWTFINCRDVEIDVNSGRKRISRYLYGITVGREISETSLSSEVSDPGSPDHWVLVSRFGPYGGHSPHYVYHSAIAQIKQLAAIWDIYDLDAHYRQTTGRGLLREWQTTGSDASADSYLRRISEEAKALERAAFREPSSDQ